MIELVLNDNDYKLFSTLVSLNQKALKVLMTKYLRSKYENVIIHKKYLVAIGDIPIALVAHMDTVFKYPVIDLYYDRQKNVLWSPDGLGADDRSGVFAIIKIIQSGLRPSIILTTDEELGGIGASALVENYLNCPIPDLKYMIELDRQGHNDCVFYDCYNLQFVDYIKEFGFEEQYGSFSDISFLMEDWNICAVNLSVGYENEHSYCEILHVNSLFSTIEKVKKMLQEKDIPDFEYVSYRALFPIRYCDNCKKVFYEYELIPVNNKVKYYCPDCVKDKVNWCEKCGEAFETTTDPAKKLCIKCVEG